MSTISIEVDDRTAQAYAAASEEQKRKLQMLVNLGLREIAANPTTPLSKLMDEMGAEAQARGLTPQILDNLLNGK